MLNLRVEVASMRIDSNRERPEVFDAKFPNTLGHQVFPINVLNRIDLSRFESRSPSDDRKITAAELLHRTYASVQ